MSDGWERIQRLAKRVAKQGHSDREVQQGWADELAIAVINIKQPPVDVDKVIDGIQQHLEDLMSEGSKRVLVDRILCGSTRRCLIGR